MIQYVTYRRVSTREQGQSGLGLEAQSRDIALFLERYSAVPYEVIGEFLDVLSGADDDRPQLMEALALCRKIGATLLVAKLDRLSRRVSFIASLMDDKRLQFRVAQMPNADKFQLHIYAALAEQERDFISQRTKAAMRSAKLRGVKFGGLREATAKRNTLASRTYDDWAERFRGIVVPMRASGSTLWTIADALNGAKMVTARGASWSPTQVSRVLERLGFLWSSRLTASR